MQLKVSCSTSDPPVGALLTAEYVKRSVSISVEWGKTTSLEAKPGCRTVFNTAVTIARYLARLSNEASLYGKTPLEKTEVDHWLEFTLTKLARADEINAALQYLDRVLAPLTYLVGQSVTIADLIVWGSLYCSSAWQRMLDNGSPYGNIKRWYSFLESQEEFKSVVTSLPVDARPKVSASVQKAPGDASSRVPKEEAKFVELPGAEMGKVVVRFPPEASGYLHIGHAKAALLNHHYQRAFEGKLIMRFDDTNPDKEKEDFEKVILEDVSMLQIKPDIFSYTSDHFEFLLEKCEELLKHGLAYVDDTDPEIMKKEREERKESKNRNNSVEKNLKMWDEMKKGTGYGQKCCVRAKIDMNSNNGCMRDPALYRCKNADHPRTGNKYKVYPTYDFACPIVDSIEGVTHALRTTEYHDRDDQFLWVLDNLNLRKPHIYEYSRLNMTHTILSKRKLTWFVENGIVSGWDDPRMPTVRGVLRRGMTVEGLKQFIVAQGSSRSAVVMDWDKIWAFNKKVIDPVAPRLTAVEKEKAVPVHVTGLNEDCIQVPLHPKNSSIGTKPVHVSSQLMVDYVDAEAMKVNENVTFINLGNLLIKEVVRNSEGVVEKVIAEANLENKVYKNTFKVTWLAVTPKAPFVSCICVYFDHLVTKAILGKDDDFKSYLKQETRIEIPMLGDPLLANIKKSEIIQLQRKGFFICDEPYDSSTVRHIGREAPVILFYIPDGTQSVSTLPEIVQKMLDYKESPKEQMQRAKGKSAEKSPQDEPGPSVADAVALQELDAKIREAGNKVRELKAGKAEKSVIDAEVAVLLKLKSDYKSLSATEWKPTTVPPAAPVKSEKASPQGDAESLNSQIKVQGDKIREMKSKKISKAELDPEIKELIRLKVEYKSVTGQEWKPDSTVPSSKKEPSPVTKATPVKKDISPVIETSEAMELSKRISDQGSKIRHMKANKEHKLVLDPEIKVLLSLKGDYKKLTGTDWKPDSPLSPVSPQAPEIVPFPNPSQGDASAAAVLKEKITAQGDKVRNLKSSGASKDSVESAVQILLALKAEYKNLTGEDLAPPSSKGKKEDKKKKGKDSRASQEKSPPKESSPKLEDTKQSDSSSAVKKVTRLGLEAKKEENLAEWYSQVITKSEMIEYYDVSGCYILRPWAYSIWEAIKDYFDKKIKALGVQNCYFPMFVSGQALEREKAHIADFAPEVAWVTKSGSSDLAEPIAIRPTSETVMYPSYAKWIKSHRDLPIQLNQWCNVVRWEFKHPQPFLRTREFLWQEGHTAFATQKEAVTEVYQILEYYASIYEDLLAVPVVRGRKTEKEKFAGGDFTTTVEAYIHASGRAIQGGTSHYLGQNFSKMFDIVFEDPETREKQFVYQNSWGLTTRTIGVMVMVHADNTGLVLPPHVALYQVVIVPCGITAAMSEEQKENLLKHCAGFEAGLAKSGIRVKGDYRDNYSPGWKFNHWELKGVPMRVEIGPRDVQKAQFVAVRRDTGEKLTLKESSAGEEINKLLETIQQSLFNKAKKELDDHLVTTDKWDEFVSRLDKKCIIMSPFCGDESCEDTIKKNSAKEDTEAEPGAPAMGAKSLCIPFDQPAKISTTSKCINPECSRKPQFYTLFGRSY